MDQSLPSLPADSADEIVYRCKVCGIESSEPTCFAAIATDGAHRLQGTCITCNQPNNRERTWHRVVAYMITVAGPTLYLAATRGVQQINLLGLVIISAVVYPAITIAHETAHALTAKITGLDVTVVRVGTGHLLWSGKLLGFAVRLYAWPHSGFTHLAGRRVKWVRLRLWLTTLMGPLTNLILASVAILLWKPLERTIDSNVAILWIAFNVLMAVVNLWPRSFRAAGRVFQSDGLQLIRIPFTNAAAVSQALSSGALGAIEVAYNDRDYLGAKDACTRELDRLPGSPWLLIMLSACHINLGDYGSAQAAIEPLLDLKPPLPPPVHAAVQNNLALALWFRNFNGPQLEQSLRRADALTADVYRQYPCVLAYRSTRALLLTATKRPEDALALLRYMNYDKANPEDRSHREIARTFALGQLGHTEEAKKALSIAFKLNKKPLPYLRTLGLTQP